MATSERIKRLEPVPVTPKRTPAPKKPTRFAPLIAWVRKLFVVRVVVYYSSAQGPLIASGLAYQAIFAVFAAVWVGFSVVGLVVANDRQLQEPLIDILSTAVPGLIKAPGSASGAIDPKTLLNAGAFTISGVIALVGVLVTALGWLASARTGIRLLFALPQAKTNFVLLKLRDLAVGLGLAIALIVSAALSVAGSALTTALLPFIGVSSHSFAGAVLGRLVTLAVMFLLDAVTLAAFFTVMAGVRIPFRRMVGGVLLGAIGLGALKVLGGSLLGVSKNNPLLASFAVILGLLIFFNIVCQVILVAAAWIKVGLEDRGIAVDPGGGPKSRRGATADVGAAP
ncbi:MAG TPA: YihY/virulence factor BrkB family protein [Galbitalea sp.]|nr:YihY/virulence factor BrkB family protein [Galbitalea sp.]